MKTPRLSRKTIMLRDGTHNRLWLVGASVLLTAVFLIDIWLPLGVISGSLYVLVSICALRASARSAIVLAAIATTANVVAYGLAPTVGIPEWMVGASRVLAVCTTWQLIVLSIYFHRQSQLVIAQLVENEARVHLASEAADLGFWGNDLSTGDLIFDERWVGMLGYRPHEVEYTAAWYDGLVHPDDRSDVELAWRKHLSGQTDSFEVEHRLKTRDGSWRRILSKGRVIERDAAGTPLRAAGTHLDVTLTRELERQASQSLRDRYQELQLVTDKIPMMIAYVDTDERFQFNNCAYERVFRLAVDAIKGMHVCHVLGVQTYNQLQRFFVAALRGDGVQFEEVVTLAGEARWWLVHLLPRTNSEGNVLGFFMLVTDVTGIKTSAAEIDLQREALAIHTNRGVANEMAAAIAHELNQPLATISIYASELTRDLDAGSVEPRELARALAFIHQESQRAGQIMRKVRESVDHRKPKMEVTDVRKLLESVRQICDVRARSARVAIDVCIDEGADHVHADWLQLQQVLVNLTNNAVDASADVADERKQVVVRASSEPEGLHICVIDRGHGLPGPHLKRVFAPYYTTKPNGLGIGLNICQSIVAAHGGKLWASENETAGATFHLTLPHSQAFEAVPTAMCEAV
jgi:PAS domain S-box-containing protein